MAKPHYRMMTDGQMMPAIRATDGFRNVVANLGTDRDKASGSTYVATHVDNATLAAAYKTSSVAKAIVDLPAEDACREWREWRGDEAQISALEAEEKRLGVVAKVLDARRRARLYGGSAIYIGTGDTDPSKPLRADTVRKGGLKYLTVLGKHEINAGEIQRDPREEGYGKPVFYRMALSDKVALNIHPSRLVVFTGDDVLDNGITRAWDGWGDSALISCMERVKQLDATLANVASLVFESKIDVIRIENFTEGLRSGGQAYERLMLDRFRLAMTAKGINGALLLDKSEEYDQKSANFSTLPDIIDRFMQGVSQAARIPMTRFFGMSPGGMNATGESDIRTYYDRIKQEQTLEMEPAMQVMDECLIRSALGARPAELHFNWRSLWQLSEKDRAEVADKLTTAAERMYRMEYPAEVLTDALTNALTENGSFPGMEAAMTEYLAAAPTDPNKVDPLTGDPVEGEDE